MRSAQVDERSSVCRDQSLRRRWTAMVESVDHNPYFVTRTNHYTNNHSNELPTPPYAMSMACAFLLLLSHR